MIDNSVPAVSVIVPIYNGAKYMHLAIDSILTQTIDDYELILVNHHSTDATPTLMKEYQDKQPDRIRCLSIDTGTTASTPKNYALQHAKGMYIAFIDCDDEVCPQYLETMLAESENGTCDMIGCSVESVDEHGKTIATHLFCVKDNFPNDFQNVKTEFEFYRHGGATATLVKRDFLLKNNILFPENKLPEDGIYSNVIAFLAKKRVLLRYPGYRYYSHKDSTSHQNGFSKFSIEMMPIEEYGQVADYLFQQIEIRDLTVFKYIMLRDFWAYTFVFCRHSSTRNVVRIAKECARLSRLYISNCWKIECVRNIHFFDKESPLYVRIGISVYSRIIQLHLEVPCACIANWFFRLTKI